MYVFGHFGFTAAGARWADPRVDLRWALALSLLPDLIDKPLRFFLPELVNANTRSFGHSFLGALAVLGALLWLRKPLLYWACYLGHFLLDRMWIGDNPAILFWPLLGGFPPPVDERWLARLLWRYNLVGEALGAALLAWTWWRFRKERPLRPAGSGRKRS